MPSFKFIYDNWHLITDQDKMKLINEPDGKAYKNFLFKNLLEYPPLGHKYFECF